ncbi:hypothetical protein OS493_006218 [Desmophyllum pertusum]|uniref:GED domain-containing protein n=1 Tax=Desmophyllum pertusum TaxID=174260 RepID=A0A9X0A817_9CNID|nr:hypothetical protein OS493_006218 [Desmophyllum pertusum]
MISNDTLRQAFNIPHLVMVGRQNMAKTTLINRLIGRYLLPMRRNETANTLQARTTYPIILNLRNGEKRTVEVKCDKILHIGGTVENPTDNDVEDFLNKVTGHLPKEEGTPISKTPVNVTLTGPELTTLTLVDLPGAHFANDDPRMNHVTQDLVLEYIEKNTNSIIVIVSEVGDPTGDSAINLVMQKAADFRSRTICVLTKPDKLRDSDDLGKRVAMNESSFTLEDNRFILLRGKDGTDPNEKDWDAEMTRTKEKEWFERHPQYKDIQHVCGIDRLMDTMISLLAEKMITEIPILVRQMKQRKTEVDEELKGLEDSEVPESSEGKGGVAMKLKNNLIKELNKLLFNNTSDMEDGGEKVRHLFNTFHEAVFEVDPLTLRDDDEIRRQQKKLEGVAAPLGESSENSQLLQKLLYEKYTGYQPNGKAVRVQSPVDKLLPLSESLVYNVEVTLREIVQKSIEHSLSKFPSLKQAVEAKVVSKIFDTKRDQTIQFIRQFLAMQKKSIDLVYAPVPTPREISLWEDFMEDGKFHPCMTSKTMSHMKDLAKKLYPEPLLKEIETVTAHKTYVNYKELDEMKNIKKNVVRCFNVLKMNMCDTVPRCILHFFVTQLVDDLGRALEQENLVEFLQERKDIRDKRIICRKQSLALAEALPRTTNVLDKLLRMKQGTPVKAGK